MKLTKKSLRIYDFEMLKIIIWYLSKLQEIRNYHSSMKKIIKNNDICKFEKFGKIFTKFFKKLEFWILKIRNFINLRKTFKSLIILKCRNLLFEILSKFCNFFGKIKNGQEEAILMKNRKMENNSKRWHVHFE